MDTISSIFNKILTHLESNLKENDLLKLVSELFDNTKSRIGDLYVTLKFIEVLGDETVKNLSRKEYCNLERAIKQWRKEKTKSRAFILGDREENIQILNQYCTQKRVSFPFIETACDTPLPKKPRVVARAEKKDMTQHILPSSKILARFFPLSSATESSPEFYEQQKSLV